MKKSTLSLAIGLLLACSTGMAKTQHLTLEQRMALLEETPGSGRNVGSKSREPG